MNHRPAERLSITIPGEPVGKGRPRFNRRTGEVYTPDATRTWERAAAVLAASAARKVRWSVDAAEPIGVRVIAVKSRPKARLRRCDPDERLWRTSKPDGDNVLKAVCDALVNAHVLVDDAQAALKTVESRYAARGETARVEVEVWRL